MKRITFFCAFAVWLVLAGCDSNGDSNGDAVRAADTETNTVTDTGSNTAEDSGTFSVEPAETHVSDTESETAGDTGMPESRDIETASTNDADAASTDDTGEDTALDSAEDTATDVETETATVADTNVDTDTGTDTDTVTKPLIEQDTSIEACLTGDTGQCPDCPSECVNEDSEVIEGCGDECGGIAAEQCPNDDLYCAIAPVPSFDGGGYCQPKQLFRCENAADCLCLPTSWAGCGWDFMSPDLLWTCRNNSCIARCADDTSE